MLGWGVTEMSGLPSVSSVDSCVVQAVFLCRKVNATDGYWDIPSPKTICVVGKTVGCPTEILHMNRQMTPTEGALH